MNTRVRGPRQVVPKRREPSVTFVEVEGMTSEWIEDQLEWIRTRGWLEVDPEPTTPDELGLLGNAQTRS